MFLWSSNTPNDSQPMSVAYLEKLNPEQRRAVEHGVLENDAAPGGPLLVIAGAGSGKTNTLAHRVAHFIINGGASPRIIVGAEALLDDKCAN
jgi:DNA helicase-2/ATP-dependent DNA helicase PcrA